MMKEGAVLINTKQVAKVLRGERPALIVNPEVLEAKS